MPSESSQEKRRSTDVLGARIEAHPNSAPQRRLSWPQGAGAADFRGLQGTPGPELGAKAQGLESKRKKTSLGPRGCFTLRSPQASQLTLTPLVVWEGGRVTEEKRSRKKLLSSPGHDPCSCNWGGDVSYSAPPPLSSLKPRRASENRS